MATAKKKQEERVDKMDDDDDDSDEEMENFKSLASSYGDDSSDNNNILLSPKCDGNASDSNSLLQSPPSTAATSHGFHQHHNALMSHNHMSGHIAGHMDSLHSNGLHMHGMLNNINSGLNVLQWRHTAYWLVYVCKYLSISYYRINPFPSLVPWSTTRWDTSGSSARVQRLLPLNWRFVFCIAISLVKVRHLSRYMFIWYTYSDNDKCQSSSK